MKMHIKTTGIGLAVAGALVLTGCASDATTTSVQTPTPTSTSTPKATPVPTTTAELTAEQESKQAEWMEHLQAWADQDDCEDDCYVGKESFEIDGWKINLTRVDVDADAIIEEASYGIDDGAENEYIMFSVRMKRVANSYGEPNDVFWRLSAGDYTYDRDINVSTPHYWGDAPRGGTKGSAFVQEIVFDVPADAKHGSMMGAWSNAGDSATIGW